MSIKIDITYPRPKPFLNGKAKRYKIVRVDRTKRNVTSIFQIYHEWLAHGCDVFNEWNDSFNGFHCLLTLLEACNVIIGERDYFTVYDYPVAQGWPVWSDMVNYLSDDAYIIMEGVVHNFINGGECWGVGPHWDGRRCELWERFKPTKFYDEEGNDITHAVLVITE